MKKSVLFLLMIAWALTAAIWTSCRAEQQDGANSKDIPGCAVYHPIDISTVGEILGRPIRNEKGENLGFIAGVVGEGNEIYYIIIRSKKSGEEEELIPLPVRPTRARIIEGGVVVDLSKYQLREAPCFKRDDRPDFLDPKWNQKIRSYYGQEPGEKRDGYYLLLR